MVSLVLTIGILNLALGYLAAVALAEPPPWHGIKLRWPNRRLPERKASPRPAPRAKAIADNSPVASRQANVPAAKPADPPASTEELPPAWLNQLAAEGIVAGSLLEGMTEVLRLEVARYRGHLLAAESRARALLAAADSGSLKLLAEDLRFLNQDWLVKQTEAAELLAKQAGRLGDDEEAAEALEQLLLDQAAQIGALCAAMESLDARAETESGGKQFLEQIASLVDHAHLLRDHLNDLLASLLRHGQRLEGAGSSDQVDPTTSLANRLGLESLFAAWWREDPERRRPLGVILVDVDRFARVNQRFGTRAGDRAIAALGRLIDESIRRDRGYDRLARVGGQTYCVLLGDTTAQQALTAAEGLRQTVEATTFDDQGAEFELTLSCGVIEVGRTESIPALLKRGAATVTFAKKAGRNRCAIDEGKGATTLEPPQVPVKGRVVHLGQTP